MQRYVIERDLLGAGKLTAVELQQAAGSSNAALRALGPSIQWEHSYVTADRIYCVYLAANEEIIHEHARLSGIPCTKVSGVGPVIDPLTGQAPAA
jgi:hypothetical protein